MEILLDVFNVLDLLGSSSGLRREAVPQVLEHVRQTAAGPVETAQSVFRFHATAPRWTTVAAESAFQLQLALRYRF